MSRICGLIATCACSANDAASARSPNTHRVKRNGRAISGTFGSDDETTGIAAGRAQGAQVELQQHVTLEGLRARITGDDPRWPRNDTHGQGRAWFLVAGERI